MMRKLVINMTIRADGFAGGPEGEIDRLLRTMDAGASLSIYETQKSAGVYIMGSRTFQDMKAYRPSSPEMYL